MSINNRPNNNRSRDSSNLIQLLRLSYSCHQTSDSILKLAVLRGVDERVNTTGGENQDHREMVEPTREVDGVTEKIEKEDDLVGCVAYDESAAYQQRSDNSVTPCRVDSRTGNSIYLKIKQS